MVSPSGPVDPVHGMATIRQMSILSDLSDSDCRGSENLALTEATYMHVSIALLRPTRISLGCRCNSAS